jgi:1-deoxy-D-xylulose-5-phosphate synthase
VVTKKGKGYLPAENDPVRFHGTGPFDIKTGSSLSQDVIPAMKTYTEVFSEKLLELAKTDEKIFAITAAMPEGTGLDKFRDTYPERFFDVGIAEGHAVCFASGLAKLGFKPVVAVYSTFLQRAYDQLIEDVALQNLGVLLAIDRAGIVGEDGATHQGIFDIAFLRTVPNLILMAPKDREELSAMLEFALQLNKPVAIRYPKSLCPVIRLGERTIELGKAEVLKEGKDFAVIALGSMVIPSLQAIEILKEEGLSGTLINARFVKPQDVDLFKALSARVKFIFTVEEGILEGGFGSAVSEAIDKPGGSGLPSDRQSHKPLIKIGLPCAFISQGKRDLILEKYGLTSQGIANKIRSVYA